MTTKPIRIQRRRTKGFRLPPNTVSVTRPGKFGNPFETAAKFRSILARFVDVDNAVVGECTSEEFSAMLNISNSLHELRGKNLACWCPLEADCHASVLLEFANGPVTRSAPQ